MELKSIVPNETEIPIITLDVDWAPGFILNFVIDYFIKNQIKSTWFITHDGEYLDKLRSNKHLFELGIHPNFSHNSSQGNSYDKVFSFLKTLIPKAEIMRTHGLFQSSNLLAMAAKDYNIKIDCSLYLPRVTGIRPHVINWNHMTLLRLPHFWADGSEKFYSDPIWSVDHKIFKTRGIKVLDFHPVHIFLNTVSTKVYGQLLQNRALNDWDLEYVKPFINNKIGPKFLLDELMSLLKGRSLFISELANKFS
tara:strand:+ start:3606 stop:4358 length:753 start_codon:yes stop_codon:yes gene_type:complete